MIKWNTKYTQKELNQFLDNSMREGVPEAYRNYWKYVYQSESNLISKSETNENELIRQMQIGWDLHTLERIKKQVDMRKEDPYRTDVPPLIHLMEQMQNYKEYISKRYGYEDTNKYISSVKRDMFGNLVSI